MKRNFAFGVAAVLAGFIVGTSLTSTIQAHNVSSLRFTSIQMFSAKNGWGEIESNHKMQILHTTSGGNHWRDVAAFPLATGESLFGSGNKAWYLTSTLRKNLSYATVFRTTDGGQTWKPSNAIPLPKYSIAQIVFAPSKDVGWLAVISMGGMFSNHTLQLWHTLDSGAHWTLMSGANPTDALLGFQNAQVGYAERSHAGGPLAAWLKGPVRSADPIAGPALYRTTDEGRTWNPQYLQVPYALTQHNGFVSFGNLSWFGSDGFMPVTFTSGQLPYKKWGLYVTHDSGNTWYLDIENAVSNNNGHTMKHIAMNIVSPNEFWESVTTLHQSNTGPYRLLTTYLYYKSSPTTYWKPVGVTPVPFVQIQFVSRKAGFALSQTGALYKTLNGGHGWHAVE